MFPGRAPPDYVALSGYVGGDRAPDLARLPAAVLIHLARSEFAELLGARGTPVVARVRHWAQGLPQYRVGHGDAVAAVARAEERWPGLVVTGNYFAGLSIAACLDQAARAASRTHAFLSLPGREPTVFAGHAVLR
jgi:oxygen-dependent protoporphyrinogen oxidase